MTTALAESSRLRQLGELTVARFALVGLVNTVIDLALFRLCEPRLGITLANVVSTTAAMSFSFVVNGRFTFGSTRPTMAQARRFLATTGTVVYVVQPILIHVLLGVLDHHLGGGDHVALAKLGAIGAILVLNFAAYRYVVWPAGEPERLSSDPRP